MPDSLTHSTMQPDSAVVVPAPKSDLPGQFEEYAPPRHFVPLDSPYISTVIIDSIAADTVSGRMPHFIMADDADSLAADSTVVIQPTGASEGIAPLAATEKLADTPLTLLLTGTFLVAAFSARGIARAVKRYSHALWSVRWRPNVFDDERTVPLPVVALLYLVFVVYGGIVLYNIPSAPSPPYFVGAVGAMLFTAAYFIFQYIAYRTVAFAFTTPEGRHRWLDGFMATQAFSSLLMVIPAFLLVYKPEWRVAAVIFSLSIYFIGRLLFVAKGFRIFYSGIRSLLYFILYLCTLEIIPLLAIFRICAYLRAYTV